MSRWRTLFGPTITVASIERGLPERVAQQHRIQRDISAPKRHEIPNAESSVLIGEQRAVADLDLYAVEWGIGAVKAAVAPPNGRPFVFHTPALWPIGPAAAAGCPG